MLASIRSTGVISASIVTLLFFQFGVLSRVAHAQSPQERAKAQQQQAAAARAAQQRAAQQQQAAAARAAQQRAAQQQAAARAQQQAAARAAQQQQAAAARAAQQRAAQQQAAARAAQQRAAQEQARAAQQRAAQEQARAAQQRAAQEQARAAQQRAAQEQARAAQQRAAQEQARAAQQRAAQEQARAAQQRAAQEQARAAQQRAAQEQARAAQQRAAQEQARAAQQRAAQEQGRAAQQRAAQEQARAAQQRAAQEQARAAQQRAAQEQRGRQGGATSQAVPGEPGPNGPRIGRQADTGNDGRRTEAPSRRLREVQRQRQERRQADRLVIHEPGRRAIITDNQHAFIRHDDNQRLAGLGRGARNERHGEAAALSFSSRNGSRVFSEVNKEGRAVRRYRRMRDGREITLFDDRPFYGPGLVSLRTPFVDLAPPVIDIPQDQYMVDYASASEDGVYQALMAPPIEPLQRSYALEEIRQGYQLRERMRSVELLEINFEPGSCEIDEYTS